MDSVYKAIVFPVAIFLGVILFGALGYMYFNQVAFIDALHMIVVTLSTCGFRTLGTTTFFGKIFDIVFIVLGFTAMISVFSKAFSLILEGQLRGIREKSIMKKELLRIKNHYIICGYGRVGSQVANQLLENKKKIVIVDSNTDVEEIIKEKKIPYVIGDHSSDETLKQANIESAVGLVACADSDIENVFITLSARTMNPHIEIIARASDPSNEDKLKRAGAHYVVSPYQTTGQKISSMILNPSVANFLERALHDRNLAVWFQEVKLPKSFRGAGKTIKELDFRKKAGVIILAIKHKNGEFDLAPQANTVLEGEDDLICLGTIEQIEALKGSL